MLSDLVARNYVAILQSAQEGAGAPIAASANRQSALRQFLEQLVAALRDKDDVGDIASTASRHGATLQQEGCPVTQVVDDYGALAHAVTTLAIVTRSSVELSEVRVMNACVAEAIASAIAEYARQSDRALERESIFRLGSLSHELRNKVGGVMLAYSVVRDGKLSLGGASGANFDRGLKGLEAFADRSLAEVRVASGVLRNERVSVRSLLDEIQPDAALIAHDLGLGFTVDAIEPDLHIRVDRAVLGGALMNLLGNAFKFTHLRSNVWLRVAVTETRVVFTVEDQCGGLTVDDPEVLFLPWVQRSHDKQGLGLGLPLVRRSAQALGGDVRVRNVPGKGCAFSLRVNRALA